MKITKEKFIEYMTALVHLDDMETRLANLIGEMSPECYPPCIDRLTYLPMRMIVDLTGDQENGWIGYWFYELDKGKKWKKGMIEDKGKDIKLKTLNDLWKILNS